MGLLVLRVISHDCLSLGIKCLGEYRDELGHASLRRRRDAYYHNATDELKSNNVPSSLRNSLWRLSEYLRRPVKPCGVCFCMGDHDVSFRLIGHALGRGESRRDATGGEGKPGAEAK